MSYKVNKGPREPERFRRLNQGSPATSSGSGQSSPAAGQWERSSTGEVPAAQTPAAAPGSGQSSPAAGQDSDQGLDPVEALLEEAGIAGEEERLEESLPQWDFGTGYLAVNVTMGRGLLPVAGAVVTVTSQQVLNQLVWGRAITDSSGQIPPLPLPAPPKLLSQYPETPQGLTYGSYNIYVQARDMVPSLRENVQVFDGITSIQNIDLTLRAAAGPEEEVDVVNESEIYDL